jgi:hypothetical protein
MRSFVIRGCLSIPGQAIRTHAQWSVSKLSLASFTRQLRGRREWVDGARVGKGPTFRAALLRYQGMGHSVMAE